MPKKANRLSLLALFILTTLITVGCASNSEPPMAYGDMNCQQLIEEIKATQTAFYRAEREARDYMNVRTGGSIGVGGGSSSGVNIGASVGIGTFFPGQRREKAQLRAENLKSELDILNRLADNKNCFAA